MAKMYIQISVRVRTDGHTVLKIISKLSGHSTDFTDNGYITVILINPDYMIVDNMVAIPL